MDINNFWKRVKDLLKAHKISLAKFAEYVNIPESTFYSWLHFSRSPEVITAYNIANALGVSVEYLITGEDRKSEKIRMQQTEARKTATVKIKKLLGEIQEEMENV